MVTLKGLDSAGDQLKGDNADFQIKKKIVVPGRIIKVVAEHLVAGLMDWVSLKLIKLPKVDAGTKRKLDEIKVNHEK